MFTQALLPFQILMPTPKHIQKDFKLSSVDLVPNTSLLQVAPTWSVRKEGLYDPSTVVLPLPLRDFMWDTAIRRMVSLSGFRASALQVGTMSDNSVM